MVSFGSTRIMEITIVDFGINITFFMDLVFDDTNNMKGKDKIKHFVAVSGIVLAVLVVFVLWVKGELYDYKELIAFVTGITAAAVKEIVWDKLLDKGTPDFYDFMAGFVAAFITVFSWIVIEALIK